MENQLEDITYLLSNEYLNKVNEDGKKSGRNNWEQVFRSFVFRKLAEFELRLQKIEDNTTS